MNIKIPGTLIFITVFTLCGDVLFLKNGRKTEGEIIQEDSLHLVIDVGIGTSRILKVAIDSVQKASSADKKALQEKWSSRYSSDERYIPPRCKKLAGKLADLESVRISARDKSSRVVLKDAQIRKKERESTAKTEEYQKLSSRLKEMDYYDNISLYWELNKKLENLRSEINIGYDEMEILRSQIDRTNPDLALYSQLYADFFALLQQEKKKLSASMSKPEKEYLDKVEARVTELENDFSSAEVAYTFTPAKHALISAVINEQAAGRFLFDTGASTVTLSRALAERLNIIIADLPVHKVSLANGELIDARPVILKSMKVDKFTVRNVQAMILDRQPEPGVDGLLGMSFLKNFLIHLDPSTNKLVFKEISF